MNRVMACRLGDAAATWSVPPCSLCSRTTCSTRAGGSLRAAPRPIAIGPQVFDLLLYLVRNREHVVSKDELLDAVWAGRIVSKSTLTSHINAARKAVGDSGEEQRLIRTIARKGFRFVGEVSEVDHRMASIHEDGARRTDETSAPAPALPDKPSIAVLPFQNLSGDPEQEYFADGVVEDIITALSRIRWLFVIARNSSFTYKGRAVDVKQVGRELGVRYVLEGSVRKAANRVRITGQLIDATTGAHLWADRFDGSLDDIFELQDQVAASVVGAIAPKLERAEIERAKRKPTESLDAYDYYLRGMAHLHQGAREAIDEALRLFHKAIELDPDFASAYAMAAWCYFWRKVNGWMTDRAQEIAEGTRLARRAVELGRDDAVALTRGGHALAHLAGDLDGGIAFSTGRWCSIPIWRPLGFSAVPPGLARRAGRRDRALRAGHAAEPARPRNVSHAGRNRGGASFRGPLRRRVLWAEKLRELPSFLMVVVSSRRAMRWPAGQTTQRPWSICESSIPRYASPISRIGYRSTGLKISRPSRMGCGKRGCRSRAPK